MTTGEYAEVKFANTESTPSLKFGEFHIDRESCTVYVGCGDFPLKEEEQTSDEVGDTSG